jgi:hypothetical protein
MVGFNQAYNDTFTGWPLAPQNEPHAVYGTFLNPTTAWPSGMPASTAGYHKAIDILVDDAKGPHPVLAIEGGKVHEIKHSTQTTPLGAKVKAGVVGLGKFRYCHVVPQVALGDTVAPGDVVGHTVPGWWHIHLEEYGTSGGDRVALNPMRPGGKLTPKATGGAPVISAMRIYPKADESNPSPRVVDVNRVRGVVVPVALAAEFHPLKEWPGAPAIPIHVYRASIVLTHEGAHVVERTLFQLDSPPGPTWQHFFRPLARRSAPVAVCTVRKPKDCTGRFWIRLWEQGWDTTKAPNGRYSVILTVEDTAGHKATRSLDFRVAN